MYVCTTLLSVGKEDSSPEIQEIQMGKYGR